MSSLFSVPSLLLWKHILKEHSQEGRSEEMRVLVWQKQPQHPLSPHPGPRQQDFPLFTSRDRVPFFPWTLG